MNLKDAFRAQNKLQVLMDEASCILQDRDNTLKVTTTHLRSKVMPEAQDVVVEDSAPSEYTEHINQVAAFLMAMLAEREKLSAAICAAKAWLSLDMDSETGLNRARQGLADTFRRMAALRNSEVVIANGGSGYRLNGEGNQVTYNYDVKQVTTIDFDRNKAREISRSLVSASDSISTSIDKVMVELEVVYEPEYSVNDAFEDVVAAFVEKLEEHS